MKAISNNLSAGGSFHIAGLINTTIRWVVGWTYFSAFWRRLILENKLDPEAAGYVGEKFNHFLPNALFVRPMIEWMVSNPDALSAFLMIFTVIEAIVGLFIMLGLFTRLMSVGVILLALGILLGAGWLGTTCLDEWQIGVLGVAAGAVVFLSGGGPLSLDAVLLRKRPYLAHSKWFAFLGSGALEHRFAATRFRRVATGSAVAVLLITLVTNQVFHGGVWGKLHNLSVKPHVVISDVEVQATSVAVTLFRDQGADVYGSFAIALRIIDRSGQVIREFTARDFQALPTENIRNAYIAKVRAGKNSLIIPLGAKATLLLPLTEPLPKGAYTLELEDISGAIWKRNFNR